jgi:tetratricopeptide (TPR) repeat protein
MQQFGHILFSIAVFLSIAFPLFSEDSILKIESLDSVQSLNGVEVESNFWYVVNKEIQPKLLTPTEYKNTLSSQEWKPYYPPENIYTKIPEWVGSKHLSLVKLIQIPEKWESPHISVRLGIINDRDKVYLNGKYIGGHGEFGSLAPQSYDRIRTYSIPTNLLIGGQVNILFVQVESYFPQSAGVEQDRMEIGPSEKIEGSLLRDEYVKLLLLMIYATVGFYFLFLFIRRRKDSENLFFGLFTMSLVVYQFFRNQLKYDLDLEFVLMKKMEYLVLALLVPFMFHFLRPYFRYGYHWLFKIADSLIAISFLIILFTSDVVFYDLLNRNFIQPIWILYIIGSFTILIQQTIKKELDAILMLGGFIFLITAATLDILSTRNLIVFPRMSGYAFIILILSIATILANKFVRLNTQVEELNANLEEKVIQRTEELNTTLEEVQKLKVQQDGDYFLTSLLLNPLNVNENTSNKILIEFFTKQKKSFEFKGKTHEIGGDISISSNIELKGKKYTVFINGDAMGKSIQGAGGALVLGVVFNAVLARSNAEINKNKYPESWIKETFMDLQRIFESFNGSMLMSVALGIIEEETGLMYYINAEHPWTVLYRDKKASFLEDELVLRKLGFPDNDEFFFVKIYQLEPGDILLAGSDGRDDILLGYDEEGRRIINEDEQVFLQVVEQGDADLESIAKILENTGEYTDDITLVKVTYSSVEEQEEQSEGSSELFDKGKDLIKQSKWEEAAAALTESLESEPGNMGAKTSYLGQSLFKLKRWDESLRYLEKSLEIKPNQTDLLFYASYSAKMNKQFLKAADFGERCYLRDQTNLKNIINLADIYKKLNQVSKANHLVERALKIDPGNRNAILLQEQLSS